MAKSGKYFAFESLGTRDGPGIRSVLFLQGCPLRCVYCHNPESWDFNGGNEISAEDVVKKLLRYKPYYKNNGGLTISGGEPLCQPEFVERLCLLTKKNGIDVAIDTSLAVIPDNIENILKSTDHLLLDVKMNNQYEYEKYVGKMDFNNIIDVLDICEKHNVDVILRRVIVKGINDKPDDNMIIKDLCSRYSCISKVEILPFMNLCISKYKELNIDFPLIDVDCTDESIIEQLNVFLRSSK